MIKIKTLNKISPVGLERLSDKYEITEDINEAQGILVRSQKMLDMDFSDNLLAIARAGVGVNNIPLDHCADQGIVVFNTPGANANGVKELVIGGMLMASRNIVSASNWAHALEEGELSIDKQVEKGKSAFRGSELVGKTIGVIGLGGIGHLVANICVSLGMKVYGYDAYLSTVNAHALSAQVILVEHMTDMLPYCDFLTVHLHANAETNGMINKKVLNSLKPGATVLNYSRASIVDTDAILDALNSGQVGNYITDFPNKDVKDLPNTVMTPHLGASTDEAEDNCAIMAVNELKDYIENGNITNAVNFPRVNLGPRYNETRLAFLTKGIDSPVDTIIDELKWNTEIKINAVNGGSRGHYGYVLINTSSPVTELPKIEGVVRTRIIR